MSVLISRRPSVAISPASMPLPLASPADKGARTPEQLRKVLQLETPGIEERFASDLNNAPRYTNGSGTVQNGSSVPASLARVQNGYGVHGVEQHTFSYNGTRAHAILNTPETIHYRVQTGADSETINSRVKQTDHTVARCVITTATRAEVDDQKSTDVQKVEHFATASQGIAPARKDVSALSSQISANGEARSVTEAFSSASNGIGTQHFMVSKPAYGSVREHFLEVERFHREEKDRLVALMTDEHEEYKRSCEEQFETLQIENEILLREISASASRITLLETELHSCSDGHPGTASQHDKVDSNIPSITPPITTVTTRIERWKHAVSRDDGQVTVSSKELEQLSSDLSNTAFQMTELQQRYTELSRKFNSVSHKLQAALSLRDEKDRTIASLTNEVTQWKNANAAKVQQTAAGFGENDRLRRDLPAASSGTAELQQHYDAQPGQLVSARDEVQRRASLLEETDRAIASLTAEVAQWKQADAAKAEQTATARRDYEKLQRELTVSSQTAELQKRYDAQSKELSSVLNELKASKSLIEKERTIPSLAAEIDQWKRADATKAEQIAAERRDKEKLQRDLTALQKRYDAQSRDIVSIRNKLQIKVSLLQEKGHTISLLTTEVAQTKREDDVGADQIASAHRDVEQGRELSSASSGIADLQKRYEAQSKELTTLRDELHQIEILCSDGTDQVPCKQSEHAVSQRRVHALEQKNKQIEELRRDLATSNARNAETQRSYEALSKDVSPIRDELKMKASQYEGTITSLTAQVDQWKRADTTKAEQIATTLKQVEKLQQDFSASAVQLTELQGRYDTQSREFVAVRSELQHKTSSDEGKDHTIASLTAEIEQLKRANANKAEHIATTHDQVEKLERDASASASKLAELQGRYEAQSRELISLENELQTKTSVYRVKDHTIASLTAELEQWKHADAAKAERIATSIQQVENLQQELSASTSQLAEHQRRYDAQSHELISVRDELRARTSAHDDKDRTIAALTTQVEEWKRTDALKEERMVTIGKHAEDLQRDLTNASSQIVELQHHYDVQSKEHISLRSQIEEWERSDATKTEELTIARKDLEKLRLDLAASTSQIEGSKRSDAAKTEEVTALQKELATTREKLEQVQIDLSITSSRIVEFQQRYDAQSKALSALREQLHSTLLVDGGKDHLAPTLHEQIEQWKCADAAKAEELARARSDIEQLQRKLTASSVQTEQLHKHFTKQNEAVRTSSIASEESRREHEKVTDVQRRQEEEQSKEWKYAIAEHQPRLNGVQHFVTTADTYADSTIVQTLQKMNAKVQQGTTFLAESVIQDFRPQAARLSEEQVSAVQRVSGSIGQTLVDCLGGKERDDMAVFLPLAFQAYITNYLQSLISSWTVEKGYDDLVNKRDEPLQKSEAQTTSGRWQSPAGTYIPPARTGDANTPVSSTVSGLAHIVVAAGCAPSLSAAKSKVWSRFGDKVSSIISIAGQLSKMMREVLSADFEVAAVHPSQVFEETTMEDVHDDHEGHASGMVGGTTTLGRKVLCSTQLGMTKRVQLEAGKRDTLTVVKTQVVLESLLDHY